MFARLHNKRIKNPNNINLKIYAIYSDKVKIKSLVEKKNIKNLHIAKIYGQYNKFVKYLLYIFFSYVSFVDHK